MDTDKTGGDTGADTRAGDNAPDAAKDANVRPDESDMPREINGPKGPEPTRYGDWEQKGRCSDF